MLERACDGSFLLRKTALIRWFGMVKPSRYRLVGAVNRETSSTSLSPNSKKAPDCRRNGFLRKTQKRGQKPKRKKSACRIVNMVFGLFL